MATLPDTQVEVATSGDASTGETLGVAITAKRAEKSRTWSVEGKTINDAVKGAVEKMFKDHQSGEFIK